MTIIENKAPCWEALCDYCGEGDNYDWGGSFHYESEATLLSELADHDWTIFRNEDSSVRALYCFSCWDEMTVDERMKAATA